MRIVTRVRTAGAAHLAATQESWSQHAREALISSFWLFCAAFAALIHAAVPGVFTHTASGIAAYIVRAVHARHHKGVTPVASPVVQHLHEL